MTTIILALISACSFGLMTVAIRRGLATAPPLVGALATIAPATALVLLASLVRFDYHGIWPFLLAGLIAPGCTQILFTLAVSEAGAARTSVAVGAAPLIAVTIAFVFLDEPVEAGIVAGCVAIVAGGVVLVSEQDSPDHIRRRGLAFAAAATVLFATRDSLTRALHTHSTPEAAAAATLLAGTLVVSLFARRIPTRTQARAFLPAGLLLGISYLCLFEAYFHGRLSVASPLTATESLWGVAFAALFLRGSEGGGRRVAVGAVLVVIGGILIGIAGH